MGIRAKAKRHVRVGSFASSAALALRHEVFVVEQGVLQVLEIDEDDAIAIHRISSGKLTAVPALGYAHANL
jgi:predicted GNAT family N-acyltransferase